jgi:hypothetical protein
VKQDKVCLESGGRVINYESDTTILLFSNDSTLRSQESLSVGKSFGVLLKGRERTEEVSGGVALDRERSAVARKRQISIKPKVECVVTTRREVCSYLNDVMVSTDEMTLSLGLTIFPLERWNGY